jgi:hypothetical protein
VTMQSGSRCRRHSQSELLSPAAAAAAAWVGNSCVHVCLVGHLKRFLHTLQSREAGHRSIKRGHMWLDSIHLSCGF